MDARAGRLVGALVVVFLFGLVVLAGSARAAPDIRPPTDAQEYLASGYSSYLVTPMQTTELGRIVVTSPSGVKMTYVWSGQGQQTFGDTPDPDRIWLHAVDWASSGHTSEKGYWRVNTQLSDENWGFGQSGPEPLDGTWTVEVQGVQSTNEGPHINSYDAWPAMRLVLGGFYLEFGTYSALGPPDTQLFNRHLGYSWVEPETTGDACSVGNPCADPPDGDPIESPEYSRYYQDAGGSPCGGDPDPCAPAPAPADDPSAATGDFSVDCEAGTARIAGAWLRGATQNGPTRTRFAYQDGEQVGDPDLFDNGLATKTPLTSQGNGQSGSEAIEVVFNDAQGLSYQYGARAGTNDPESAGAVHIIPAASCSEPPPPPPPPEGDPFAATGPFQTLDCGVGAVTITGTWADSAFQSAATRYRFLWLVNGPPSGDLWDEPGVASTAWASTPGADAGNEAETVSFTPGQDFYYQFEAARVPDGPAQRGAVAVIPADTCPQSPPPPPPPPEGEPAVFTLEYEVDCAGSATIHGAFARHANQVGDTRVRFHYVVGQNGDGNVSDDPGATATAYVVRVEDSGQFNATIPHGAGAFLSYQASATDDTGPEQYGTVRFIPPGLCDPPPSGPEDNNPRMVTAEATVLCPAQVDVNGAFIRGASQVRPTTVFFIYGEGPAPAPDETGAVAGLETDHALKGNGINGSHQERLFYNNAAGIYYQFAGYEGDPGDPEGPTIYGQVLYVAPRQCTVDPTPPDATSPDDTWFTVSQAQCRGDRAAFSFLHNLPDTTIGGGFEMVVRATNGTPILLLQDSDFANPATDYYVTDFLFLPGAYSASITAYGTGLTPLDRLVAAAAFNVPEGTCLDSLAAVDALAASLAAHDDALTSHATVQDMTVTDIASTLDFWMNTAFFVAFLLWAGTRKHIGLRLFLGPFALIGLLLPFVQTVPPVTLAFVIFLPALLLWAVMVQATISRRDGEAA